MLLEDLKRLFDENDGDNLPTVFVVEELNKMETRPWPEFSYGKPITARQVNKLLENFGIKAKQVRLSESKRKANGFTLKQCWHVFNRYVQDPGLKSSASSDKPSKPKGLAGQLPRTKPRTNVRGKIVSRTSPRQCPRIKSPANR